MESIRIVVYYSGRVQGVGFRYTVKTVVTGYDAVGMVRNLPDGRVELIVEGEKEELAEFLQAIRDAGLARHIRDEQMHEMSATGEFRGFEIAGSL